MLKSYLRALFKRSGSLAFPASNAVQFENTVATGWSQTFTSPFDGYVCIFGGTYGCTYISISCYDDGIRTSSQYDGGFTFACLPIRKGSRFNYELKASSASDATVYVIPAAGSL